MDTANNYYQDLQGIENEQGIAKLRTLALEFSSTLKRLPKLTQEVDAMLETRHGINYGDLTSRLEPSLVKATELLLELDLLPAELRNVPEIQEFAHALAVTLTGRTVDSLDRKFQALLVTCKQQAEAEEITKHEAALQAEIIRSQGFLDNGDGTVTDVHTKLTWKRCEEGQVWNGMGCIGESISMPYNVIMPDGKPRRWDDFAGKTGWRIPEADELLTLVRKPIYGNSSRAISDFVFPKSGCSFGAVATLHVADPTDKILYFDCHSGKVEYRYRNTPLLTVRLVNG